jgi:hypothetical protein
MRWPTDATQPPEDRSPLVELRRIAKELPGQVLAPSGALGSQVAGKDCPLAPARVPPEVKAAPLLYFLQTAAGGPAPSNAFASYPSRRRSVRQGITAHRDIVNGARLDDEGERMMKPARRVALILVAVIGAASLAYTIYFVTTWIKYGKTARNASAPNGELLDQFLPAYDVSERHEARVDAPASVTYQVGKEVDPNRSPLVRAIFQARQSLMGGKGEAALPSRPLLQMTKDLGWRVLAEVPDRVIVMGALTQPWQAQVRFQALSPDQFAAFHQPGYVKIIWTIEADSVGPLQSIARTQTRVQTTDPAARARFRTYWSKFSPGILVIRQQILAQIKAEAERRAREERGGQSR